MTGVRDRIVNDAVTVMWKMSRGIVLICILSGGQENDTPTE